MALTLLDTNVLVHAVYEGSSLNPAAARLVARGLGERGLYCIAPQNLIEFAAVTSRARFVSPPLHPSEIARISNVLYRSRRLTKIYPRRGTVARAIRDGAALGIAGPRWYDFFLASTMRDAGVQIIITEDVEHFRQFPAVTAVHIRDAP